MSESDGSRRPSLTRWLTSKVEGLAGGGRRGAAAGRPGAAAGRPGAADGRPGPAAGRGAPDPELARQAGEIARLRQEGERLTKELDDAQVMLIGKEAEFSNELQDLQERNAELLDKIVKLTQRDRELQAKVLDAKFDGTGAKDQAKKLDTDLRDLRRSHKAAEEQIAKLESQIAQLESQIQVMEKEAAGRPDPEKAAAEAEVVTKRLQEALARNQALADERDGLRSKLANAAGPAGGETGEGDDGDAIGSLAQARGHLAMGPASDPLKAMAAGKRPAVARQVSEFRQRQGDAAQRLLESGDRGFATLPEGFIEALVDNKRRRSAKGEQSAARRGGAKRKSQSRGRSRKGAQPRSRKGAGNR